MSERKQITLRIPHGMWERLIREKPDGISANGFVSRIIRQWILQFLHEHPQIDECGL